VRKVLRFIRPALLMLVLVAVIGGVPWGLAAFFSSAVPDHFPGYGDVKAWLDAAKLFPDQALTDVLVYAAWGLWALFTIQIAMQLPLVVGDLIRCLRTGVVMPGAENANLAGRLLTSIALGVVAARGTVGVASAAALAGGHHFNSSRTGVVSVAGEKVVRVAAGDSLWDIAERCLGRGERWGEIFDLNRHRVQDDGEVLTDPELIRPGWRLVLPGVSAEAPLALREPSRADHPATSVRAAPTISVPAPMSPRTGGVRSATTAVGTSSRVDHSAAARPVVRRPVAVSLPTGGYVSLTLAAGFTAALAAARIRSRVRPRHRDPDDRVPLMPRRSEAETSLLRAANVLGFHDDDPYIDSAPVSDVERVPPALAELRAPEAVYFGICGGRPILLETAAGDGLALVGDGAQDAARALLLSCLTAGGFLASSVAFPVVTTDADLQALLGEESAARQVEYLTVCATYAEAVKEANSATADRCLLLATPSDAPAEAPAAHVVTVHLGSRQANSIADINAAFEITASGPAAKALEGATAYHLGLSEARDLFGHLPLAWSHPDATAAPPAEPMTSAPPAPRTPMESASFPPQASHAKPVASEAITINILGPVQALCHGIDITGEVRTQLAALLTYLVLHKNGVSRAALAADLWPDEDPAKRKILLTTALSHTRTALAAAYGSKPEFFPRDRTAGVAYLNPQLFDADVWRFDALTKKNEAMSSAGRVESLSEAVALYRGEVAHIIEHANKLTEQYETWLWPVRDEYSRRMIDAYQDLGELLRESDPERALDALDQAIRMEPWNQRLYETLIEVHLDLGQRHAAERRFRELSGLLASLGTQPSAAVIGLVDSHVA
jgi:DNA-binding SARP family transcriptional activator